MKIKANRSILFFDVRLFLWFPIISVNKSSKSHPMIKFTTCSINYLIFNGHRSNTHPMLVCLTDVHIACDLYFCLISNWLISLSLILVEYTSIFGSGFFDVRWFICLPLIFNENASKSYNFFDYHAFIRFTKYEQIRETLKHQWKLERETRSNLTYTYTPGGGANGGKNV